MQAASPVEEAAAALCVAKDRHALARPAGGKRGIFVSGARGGLVAGQAWEGESEVQIRQYHLAKTAGLFEAACFCGALAGGGDPDPWLKIGRRIGEAYQLADDLQDLVGDSGTLGKPIGQDLRHGRPNAAFVKEIAQFLAAVDKIRSDKIR